MFHICNQLTPNRNPKKRHVKTINIFWKPKIIHGKQLNSVQNPSLIPLNPGCFIGIPLSYNPPINIGYYIRLYIHHTNHQPTELGVGHTAHRALSSRSHAGRPSHAAVQAGSCSANLLPLPPGRCCSCVSKPHGDMDRSFYNILHVFACTCVMCTNQAIYLIIYLCIYLPTCLSIYLPTCLSIYLPYPILSSPLLSQSNLI